MSLAKILFIAPLPPPIHGQSLASEVFLREINKTHEVLVVNTSKKKTNNLRGSIKRVLEVASLLMAMWRGARKADIIYLTISESILGNLKDLLTYLLCFGKLDIMFIHLHGGAGMVGIMKGGNGLLARLNAFFLQRMKGVIILGELHRPIFEQVIPADRIHIVPNFAEDYLFIDDDRLRQKFRIDEAINFLFLSNLINGKGYLELLEAYLSLPGELKSKASLHFAGAFQSETHKCQFLERILDLNNIFYHGIVSGDEKKKLFTEAQVFCLPTYYPYEGQPISILEAYAAGCVVISTNHSGIGDIFKDRINGYQVEIKSADSIRQVMEHIIKRPDELLPIGINNRKIAGIQYRTSIYNASLKKTMGIQ